MENQWTIPPTDPQRHDRVQPTVERLGPTFEPNTPAHQRGEDATTQNCSCPECSEAQRIQVGPTTWHPVGQQNSRQFTNVDFHHPNQDQNVDNRVGTATIVPESTWASQTANNMGYAPVRERAGPPNMGLTRAPTLELDPSIAESRRRLADRYLNNPDVFVSTIRLEPGPFGELQVVITLIL